MALILNIDTAQEQAGLFLASDGKVLESSFHHTAHDHASWIHEAIREIVSRAGITLKELQAVAITAGPGSYTGLRIGMATAKGLCYALGVPLIMVSTLKVMAAAVRDTAAEYDLICPMIDARRMEVFMGIYRKDLSELCAPRSFILEYDFFLTLLDENRIIFCGSGTEKWKKICDHANAYFFAGQINSSTLASLSYELFQQKTFTDLTYAEPDYLKDFYTYPKPEHRRI
jgi:tRNA threonylcarbamoyladenosine biosynthesis protein TsaB